MGYIHGGRVVAHQLAREGVKYVFTLCGGHVQNIYDGCIDEGIKVIDTRHEQTAGHAADGWARATGEPGVAIVTAGPGVTDVVTAAANAYRAGVPMVILGGAGPFVLRHMGSLQDMDHLRLMRTVTKWAETCAQFDRIPEYVAMAFRQATSGVPGPVFLELPLDLLLNMADESEIRYPTGTRTRARIAPDPDALEEAGRLLMEAKRPTVIVGSQIRWSQEPMESMLEFLDTFQVPVFVNGMARGTIPAEHPLFMNRARTEALLQSDLVLIFGTPLDFRLNYGREDRIPTDAKLIMVDQDATIIGQNRHVDVGLVADTGLVLRGLVKAAKDKGGAPDRSEWMESILAVERRRRSKMLAEMESSTDPINPLRLCADINKVLKPGSIVIGDGGDFVATAAYTLNVSGVGSWMDPGPLGTLGVGPGYAMAAKLAHPDKDVVLIFGDGSFGLNGMEFEAMARQGIPVKAVIGNDACWTQIYRGQVEFFGEERAVATQLDYTRYDIVAQGLGAHGEYVETVSAILPALQRAWASPKPAVVNVKIGRSDFRKGSISV